MTEIRNITTTAKLKMATTFLVPIIVACLPTNELFTRNIKFFMAITLWGILMFVFEQVPNMVAVLLMVLAYLIFNVAPIDVVMKPWTMDLTWVAIGSLFLISIVMSTKLLERIGYTVLAKFGKNYISIIFSMLITGLIIRILVGATCALAALAVIMYAVCTSCGWGKSKASAGVMLAGLIGFSDSDLFLFSPDFFAILPAQVSTVIPEVANLNYPIYLWHNLIFVPIVFVEAFIIAKICGKNIDNTKINKEIFHSLKSQLPPMSTEEKKILLVLLVLVIYLFTQTLHGLPMMYGFLLAPLLLCFPGIKVGTLDNLLNANYAFLFFFTGCQAIGQVAGSVGIGEFINATLVPHLEGVNEPVLCMLIYLFAFLLNFIMTPAAELNAFGVPLAEITTQLDYGIYPVMYSFFNGVSNFILPYESAWPLFVYTFGLIPMADWIKIYSIKAVLCFVWLATLGLFWWNFIGLMG